MTVMDKMGLTIAEKIIARAAGRASVAPGDIVTVEVDRAVLLDTTFFFLEQMRCEVLQVPYPERLVIVFDHEVPAPGIPSAAAQIAGRRFASQWGIGTFHDLGREQGISHVLMSDEGYARPGMLVVGSDSHSSAAGVMNCAARAITILDLLAAMTTGRTWLALGPTVRYDFEGTLGDEVGAMDLFLHIAARFGDHAGCNVEYGGPGLAGLSIEQRRTVATMSTELNVDFATFEADARLESFLRERGQPCEPVEPDKNAAYLRRVAVDLSEVRPMVATPGAILGQAHLLGETETAIDQAFIGSCAHGSLPDIAEAARVMRGRRVAQGVRLVVTPASQRIWRAAAEAGHLAVLAEAGAIVTSATCGACAGGHLGVLGPDERCVASATRNFQGRMGHPTSQVWLASPANVAASAVAGRLVAAEDLA